YQSAVRRNLCQEGFGTIHFSQPTANLFFPTNDCNCDRFRTSFEATRQGRTFWVVLVTENGQVIGVEDYHGTLFLWPPRMGLCPVSFPVFSCSPVDSFHHLVP